MWGRGGVAAHFLDSSGGAFTIAEDMSVVTTVVTDVPVDAVCSIADFAASLAGGVDPLVLQAFPFV
jgi:hypothetical protein